MAKVTYLDEDGSAPAVEFMGIAFRDGEAVIVDNEAKLRMIGLNRFFVVEEGSDEPVKRGPVRPPKTKEEGGE